MFKALFGIGLRTVIVMMMATGQCLPFESREFSLFRTRLSVQLPVDRKQNNHELTGFR
jgi:hypothetical protein